MADILERLRMDADDANPYQIDQDGIMEAADEIEQLRQRVKELEKQLAGYIKEDEIKANVNKMLVEELATLKAGQGETEETK